MGIKVPGLARVRMLPTADERVVTLELTDAAGKRARFAIGPEGLNALLTPALGLATRWADSPELAVETLVGPANCLPARAVRFDPIPPAQAAIRVFVGQVEISFLIPLDDLVSAMGRLVKFVDSGASVSSH